MHNATIKIKTITTTTMVYEEATIVHTMSLFISERMWKALKLLFLQLFFFRKENKVHFHLHTCAKHPPSQIASVTLREIYKSCILMNIHNPLGGSNIILQVFFFTIKIFKSLFFLSLSLSLLQISWNKFSSCCF